MELSSPRAWIVLLACLLAGCAVPPAAGAAAEPPNIVFVLADDLSWDLIPHMPQVRKLQRDGMTFRQFVVADSMCCSSRATILTGEFPHNTRVLTNTWPEGGYRAFRRHGARMRSVGIALQQAGYRTAVMGKYLNAYSPPKHGVDPGWDEWFVTSMGYRGFDYRMSDNGRVRHYGHRARDYMTDVLARRGVRFIRRSAGHGPFFLKIASFAPHRPYTPAPRHRHVRPRAALARGVAFDAHTRAAPTWLGHRPPLTRARLAGLRRQHAMRVRSVQALDELIGRLRATLRRKGIADNTYVVFSSDNGYHLGQHRLTVGKRTAFDHDVRVPLIVAGPGVRARAASSALVGTVDLAPTFEDWAGAPADDRRDGRSLARHLSGRWVQGWRQSLLIEHAEPRIRAGDPDVQGWAMGLPSSYSALRTRHLTYVEYENGDRELYDRRRDPGELDNRAGRISAARLARLHAKLERYRRCRGTASCWSAATSAVSRPQAARSAATAPSRSSSAADGHGASPARSASARR
jgi:N-acetylglucosamine-6-sulfatase